MQRLEDEIDEMNAELQAAELLRPSRRLAGRGGAACGAHRVPPGRAEMVALAAIEADEPVSEAALKYVNRLSDFLFVAGRYVNDRGKSDVLWVPGQNR